MKFFAKMAEGYALITHMVSHFGYSTAAIGSRVTVIFPFVSEHEPYMSYLSYISHFV